MCSDTAWSIPCCVVGSDSSSGEGPLSAVVAPLLELEDDGTEGRSEESGKWHMCENEAIQCQALELVNSKQDMQLTS